MVAGLSCQPSAPEAIGAAMMADDCCDCASGTAPSSNSFSGRAKGWVHSNQWET